MTGILRAHAEARAFPRVVMVVSSSQGAYRPILHRSASGVPSTTRQDKNGKQEGENARASSTSSEKRCGVEPGIPGSSWMPSLRPLSLIRRQLPVPYRHCSRVAPPTGLRYGMTVFPAQRDPVPHGAMPATDPGGRIRARVEHRTRHTMPFSLACMAKARHSIWRRSGRAVNVPP